MQIVRDPSVLFVVYIPGGSPTGLGNMLKGLVSFLSVHPNTKLENGEDRLLGNYSTVFDSDLIHFPEDRLVNGDAQVELVTTYKFLFLREFADSIDTSYHNTDSTSAPYLVDNPRLVSAFSPTLSIDQIFNRSLLPTPVVRKILSVIRNRIKFQPKILQIVNDITDSMIHPSLGVSVRSWKGVHETSYGDSRTMPIDVHLAEQFSEDTYKRLISAVIHEHGIRSVFISYDSPVVEISFREYIQALRGDGIQVLSYGGDTVLNELSSLQVSAVNMLALSNTNVLIGDNHSTFVELVYWFGECKQVVYHPDGYL